MSNLCSLLHLSFLNYLFHIIIKTFCSIKELLDALGKISSYMQGLCLCVVCTVTRLLHLYRIRCFPHLDTWTTFMSQNLELAHIKNQEKWCINIRGKWVLSDFFLWGCRGVISTSWRTKLKGQKGGVNFAEAPNFQFSLSNLSCSHPLLLGIQWTGLGCRRPSDCWFIYTGGHWWSLQEL